MENNSIKKVRYDDKYDILYIYFDPERWSYGDEYGSVTLMRNMDNDSIVGLTIFSPARREDEIKRCLDTIREETSFDFDLNAVKAKIDTNAYYQIA